jgi:uncharacterized protein YndB with AHSA1/START domain
VPDVIHERTYSASPEQLLEAVTSERGLASFWTDQTTAQAEVGSTAAFGFGPSGETQFAMRIDAIAPDRVEWTCTDGPDEWRGTRVRWLIAAADAGTRLRFEHLGWASTDGALGACSYTWAMILDRLEHYLASGEARPYFAAAAPAG